MFDTQFTLRRLYLRIAIVVFVSLFIILSAGNPAEAATTIKKSKRSVPKRTVQPVGKPAEFHYPRLGIHAAVESVGLAVGRIGLPSESTNVGWFTDSPRPGQRGNSIIDGHLDTFNGPAVFWRLKRARPGDEFTVIDERRRTFRYRVTDLQVYSRTEPRKFEDVFDYTTKFKISLITCAGKWIRSEHQYSQNLVVNAELVPSSKILR